MRPWLITGKFCFIDICWLSSKSVRSPKLAVEDIDYSLDTYSVHPVVIDSQSDRIERICILRSIALRPAPGTCFFFSPFATQDSYGVCRRRDTRPRWSSGIYTLTATGFSSGETNNGFTTPCFSNYSSTESEFGPNTHHSIDSALFAAS